MSSVKINLKMFLITLFSLLLFTLGMNSARADEQEAKNFINDLAYRAISIVKRTDIDDETKEKKLTNIFLASVDTKFIGKFALGKYWRSLDSSQQSVYLSTYSKYLVSLYVPKFRQYTGDVVKVLDAKEIRPSEYLVQTQLGSGTGDNNIKINYSVQQDPRGLEKFIIFDIIAEGVSLIITQRADIGAVMSNGSFDDLIALLKKKTSSTASKK